MLTVVSYDAAGEASSYDGGVILYDAARCHVTDTTYSCDDRPPPPAKLCTLTGR